MRNYFATTNRAKFIPTKNWDTVLRKLARLEPEIKQCSLRAQKSLANDILKKVLSHLIKQDLKWRKLSKKYKERKRTNDLDERILLATHSYFSSITVWTRKNGWQAFVGVPKGVYGKTPEGKKSSLDISTIATIHEFSKNPKRRRPLWNPTIREMGNTTGLKNRYTKLLLKELRSSGLGSYIKAIK